jgi:iron complex transport system substrate-binding protein
VSGLRTPRIASLLASGTEIVAALALEDHLVAISHECDFPSHLLDRPRLSRARFDPRGMESGEIDRAVRRAMAEHGSVYAVDGELMERLAPDLILTQAVCEVCAVPTPGVRELVAERGMGAEVLSLDAHTIEEILASIEQVGEAAGAPARAHDLVASLRERLQRVAGDVPPRPGRTRVLALEWLAPPFAPGHWVPEMIEAAGGENLVGVAGGHSHEVAWKALEALDPDLLLIMPCGYGLEASAADADRHAERLRAVAPRAVGAGSAYVVDGSSYFNRSGPRVVDGVEILAGLLHPGSMPEGPQGTWASWGGAAARSIP